MLDKDRKSVLLLNPPGDRNYLRDGYCSSVAKGMYFWPPTDLLVLSGVLDQNIFDIHIIDCIAEGFLISDVLNYIQENDIDIVISQVASASKDTDLLLLKYIKESFHDILILVNGEYALKIPEYVLNKYHFIDAVIHDYTSNDVQRYLLKEDCRFNAVSHKTKSEVILHMGKQDMKMAFINTPRHDLIRTHLYNLPWTKRLPMTATITSFGCSFNCSFCVAGTYRYKSRDIESVIDELMFVSELGIKEVYFLDPLFTANKKRTIELCEKIVSNSIDITWTCLSRVNTFDAEMFSAMKNAGCHTIQLGIESGSDEVLKNINKGFTVKDIEKAVNLANKYKINVDGFFILGFPRETKEQINATIELAKRLDFNLVSFQLAMPLKGTKLEKQTVTVNDISFDDADNAISINDNFTTEELKKIQRGANLQYYFRLKFILKRLFQIRSWTILKSSVEQALNLAMLSKKPYRDVTKHEAFQKTLTKYKEKSSTVYWHLMLKKTFYNSWLWNILYLLPPSGKIYDLGCGFGFLGNLVNNINGNRIVIEGIDIQERRIKVARAVANGKSNVNFKIGNILDCDFNDANAVVLADFLHHIPLELQNKIISRIYDTLPVGGIVLIKEISSKKNAKLKYYFALALEKVLYPFNSVFYREEDEICHFLKRTGFTKVDLINKVPHYIIKCEK